MTTVYFIRHATPDRSSGKAGNDAIFPLSEKGLADVPLVTAFLSDKKIDAVLSSPFKRSYDTVADFAQKAGLEIEVIHDFRERAISDAWLESSQLHSFDLNQWEDFSYKLPGGENFTETQARNIAALEDVLARYKGKNIAVGTHGTALSLIINHYDRDFGYDASMEMSKIMPWVAKLIFDGTRCIGIETGVDYAG
ncbi:MAG: histidine phosphatase family protein [Defluviitaleaceae bacterium]|nr:histidine phosphatase family protein [Defluviitaleaceae bacterium]